MKRIFLAVVCLLVYTTVINAQKWVNKAKKAVFSVQVYDKDNNIMNTGNGFFINNDGTAVSDFSLFKGAYSASIVDEKGKKYPVDFIMGASDLYDMVKFHVNLSGDKNTSLVISRTQAKDGEKVYLMPYPTQNSTTCTTGTVSQVSPVDSLYAYYTFSMSPNSKQVSCPVMNEAGEVIAMMQQFKDTKAGTCYGLDPGYADKLVISPLSVSDFNLNAIHIRKALPAKPDDAEVYIMMKQSSASAEEYGSLLDQYISQFPDNAGGYLRRATYYLNDKKYPECEQDLKKYLDLNPNKDDAHYNIGRLIYNKSVYQEKESYKDWNLDKALLETNEAYNIKPNPLYLVQKGDILFAQKKYKDAYDNFIAVTKTPLRSAAQFFSASRCLQLAGDSVSRIMALQDSAVNCFKKPYPNEAAPYIFNRAEMRTAIGEYRQAVEDYNDFEHIVAGNVTDQFYYKRASAEMSCNMYQQALDDITDAIQKNPDVAAYYTLQSSVYIIAKDTDNALKAAQKAVALDDKSGEAYRYLGYCQSQKGQNTEALKNLNKAKELGDPVADKLIQKMNK